MSIPGAGNPLLLGGAVDAYEIERSLRFNSSDSAYLSRTPASAGNRKTWTWAGWVKRCKLSVQQSIFGNGLGNGLRFRFESSDTLRVLDGANGANLIAITTELYRDTSAWYHIVLTIDTTQSTGSDRAKIYVNGIRQSLTYTYTPLLNLDLGVNDAVEHQISNAVNQGYCDFYLADVHFIDGQALTPTSFGEFDTNGIWQPIEYTGTYGTNGFHLPFSDNSSAAALGTDTSGNGNDWTTNNFQATVQTGRLYAQSSGTSTSAFSSATLLGNFPAAGGSHAIFDADLLTATTSATFSYTYTFSSLVEVLVSADGINWTSKGNQSSSYTTVTHTSAFRYVRWFYSTFTFGITNNPANSDSLVDSPTNYGTDTGAGGEVRGNYATLNPLFKGANVVLSNGNLQSSITADPGPHAIATIGMDYGGNDYYCEFTYTAVGVNSLHMVGLVKAGVSLTTNYIAADANGWGYFGNGNKYTNGSASAYGSSWGLNDVIGIAYKGSTGELFFYKNGVVQNSGIAAFSGLTSGPYFFAVGNGSSGTGVLNFGQRPFAYTAPSGFKALCTQNLPTPTIADGSSAMDVALYTGTGATLTPTSSLGFSPDLVWIKSRSAATDHTLYDAVRGAQARLESNTTGTEVTSDNGLTAFNSNGFTLGTLAQVNTNAATYAGWCWDAGSSTVTNTDGSISSQVRANASAGFSIVTYTGTGSNATVGHGLGVAPKWVIVKLRSGAADWCVWVKEVYDSSNSAFLFLNTTNALFSNSGVFNSSATTSTTFPVGVNAATNGSSNTYVAYCFAPVDGYSSFGSYTGNGSADGPFVYTGFRPRWLMVKSSSSTETWNIYDTVRGTHNVVNMFLQAQSSAAEASNHAFDILSNGFKLRLGGGGGGNSSGVTYIYAAFAENPFKYSRAR